MINLMEMVKLKWTTRNKKYYQEKGYECTRLGDELWVHIKDLPLNSNERVPVSCDCPDCSNPVGITPYRNYNRIVKENGEYKCRPCAIKIGVGNRTQKSHKRLYDLFLQKCKEKNCIPVTTFEEFHGYDTEMAYICPIHGKTSTLMERISNEDAWCRKCGHMRISECRTLSNEDVKRRVESKNGNVLLNPEEYQGSTVRNLRVLCGRCGNQFVTSLSSINNGSGMCPTCGSEVCGSKTKYSMEDIIEMSNIDGVSMVVNPEDYKNMETKLKFLCSSCNQQYTTTPHLYIIGGFTRCENCKIKSQGQEDIKNVLNEFRVEYIPQMRFDDCRDKRRLPFDFYLPAYNLLIQFNGGQHYYSVEYFGGQEHLEYVQKHDAMKKQYAIDNGFDYLVISYEDQKNIREILINKLGLE